MSDRYTDLLSEYLDAELTPSERAAVEAHLQECGECRETLAGLRRVVARARALEDRPPGEELWPGIAVRIGLTADRPDAPERGRRGIGRRLSLSLPQLAAAGIVIAGLSGGAVWLLQAPGASGNLGRGISVRPPAAPATVVAAGSPGTPAARSYDAAVADLERVLEAGRGRLDSTTVRVLEQNLALIDAALAEARRALAADSASLYLNSHLAETMRRKLELLRRAAALVATAS